MVQEREGEDYDKLITALSRITDKLLTLEPEIEQISQPMLL